MQCKNSTQLPLEKKETTKTLHIFKFQISVWTHFVSIHVTLRFYNLEVCNDESGRWWLSGSQPWGVQNKCGSVCFTLWLQVVQTGQALSPRCFSVNCILFIFISFASRLLANYWEVMWSTHIVEVTRCKCMCCPLTVTGCCHFISLKGFIAMLLLLRALSWRSLQESATITRKDPVCWKRAGYMTPSLSHLVYPISEDGTDIFGYHQTPKTWEHNPSK